MSNGLWTNAMQAANRSPRIVLSMACLLLGLPVLMLGWNTWHGTLGINPLDILVRTPARWSLIWLLTVLSMAPLKSALVRMAQLIGCYGRRQSDWNWFIRLRRPVGLASFFYAGLHLVLYVALDLDYDWSEFLGDLRDKPYIDLGIAAFLLMLPLALTSTNTWMRRLQMKWKRLHMLVYPVAICIMAHFLLLTKPGVTAPLPYAVALAVLLMGRLAARWLHKNDTSEKRLDGTVKERQKLADKNTVVEIHPI